MARGQAGRRRLLGIAEGEDGFVQGLGRDDVGISLHYSGDGVNLESLDLDRLNIFQREIRWGARRPGYRDQFGWRAQSDDLAMIDHGRDRIDARPRPCNAS